MAERRMFAKTIIDSDAFLDMPQSTQLLYFHLSMRADDDGFINKPKSIMREVGCKDDDLKILASKKFLIPFESGVVVIKHWKIHNYIAKDRYTETKYNNEKAKLILDENNSYTECIQNIDNMDTQVRLGKVRLGKVSIDKEYVEEIAKEDELNKPPSSNKFDDASYQITASKNLFNKIQSINPKANAPNYQKWADHIDKLIRINKRTEKEIDDVIEFATGDTFWQCNILSTAKLRDKFDTLFLQMNKKPKQKEASTKKNNFSDYSNQREYNYEEMERKALQNRLSEQRRTNN